MLSNILRLKPRDNSIVSADTMACFPCNCSDSDRVPLLISLLTTVMLNLVTVLLVVRVANAVADTAGLDASRQIKVKASCMMHALKQCKTWEKASEDHSSIRPVALYLQLLWFNTPK